MRREERQKKFIKSFWENQIYSTGGIRYQKS